MRNCHNVPATTFANTSTSSRVMPRSGTTSVASRDELSQRQQRVVPGDEHASRLLLRDAARLSDVQRSLAGRELVVPPAGFEPACRASEARVTSTSGGLAGSEANEAREGV